MSAENANLLIKKLASYPGGRLIDSQFVEQCKNYSGDDPILFLRDLRDDLVYYSGCADGIIAVISIVVDEIPETPEAMQTRRSALEQKRQQPTK